ncbi:MAG: carboxyl transferase domain-containing protein, partial [Propionibacteriaceae bacterium]|nr:carboxyl transferase domain-containing protein [Propionibacteriaceae bacterium]
LQVEHPITESVTGFDLVTAQLRIAAGEPLTGERPGERGHAVEARLNAEDPDRDFAPAPGRIARLEFPSGPGIRIDTGVAEGDTIPGDFDSMIAKIIAQGDTREQALARLRRAVNETIVVIDGGATNKSFISELLNAPEVVRGEPVWADTGWIDRVREEGRLGADRHAGIALVAAAIQNYVEAERGEITTFLATASGGRPQPRHETGQAVELKLGATSFVTTVHQSGPGHFTVTVAGDGIEPRTLAARLQRIDDVHSRITVDGQRHRLVTAAQGTVHLIEVDGVAHRVSRDEGGMLRSPAPALVVATPVAAGDEVAAGAPVLVLESMKMETALNAPFAARVKEVMVRTGTQVETGVPLIKLEPTGEATTTSGGSAVELDLPPAATTDSDPAARGQIALHQLRGTIRGYDTPDHHEVLRTYLAHREALAAAGVDVLAAEERLLSMFADFAELSRNQPSDDDQSDLRVHSAKEHFHAYLRWLDPERDGIPSQFHRKLERVLRHYGVNDLERTPILEEAVFRIALAQQRGWDAEVAAAILGRWAAENPGAEREPEIRALLDRITKATQRRHAVIGDLARSIRFRWFDQPIVDAERAVALAGVREEIAALADPDAPDRSARLAVLAGIPEKLVGFLAERLADGLPTQEPMLEVLIRRHYQEYALADLARTAGPGPDGQDRPLVHATYRAEGHGPTRVVSTIAEASELEDSGSTLSAAVEGALSESIDNVVELYVRWPAPPSDHDETAALLLDWLSRQPFAHRARRVSVAICQAGDHEVDYLTFRPRLGAEGELVEDELIRGVHPMVARRLSLWRLTEFELTRLPSPEDVLLYEAVARSNPADRRLVAMAQVRQLAVTRDSEGKITGLPLAERAVEHCLEAIRRVRTARHGSGSRLDLNHVWVTVWPRVDAEIAQLTRLQTKITPLTEGAGIEEVLTSGRVSGPDGQPRPVAIRFHQRPGRGVVADVISPPDTPLKPLDDYASRALRARRRGLTYPYELAPVLAGPDGTIIEYDLTEAGVLEPTARPLGQNTSGMITAVVSTPTKLYPEGITRVVLCGDPTRALGAVAEEECRRVIAAIDLAERLQVPLEWFAVSAGAKVSMDSGTENMDWVAAALRRIIEFTQAGGEINVIVAGINVGAQPYWNAEATMLMHTRGILIMTPASAMVLTGKQSLDFSGGVSAEDNFGIGGYDRVMGPNGQAQYWVPDLAGAFDVLLQHYAHTYVAPGERWPRQASSTDPVDRDVSPFPHTGEFETVGEIFSAEKNPERKKPFDIRTVMRAVADQDATLMERWAGMADADTAVVADTRLGGHSVCLIGIESQPVPRHGHLPADGPVTWTAGTLFPQSSKKVARAINAASGNRPVVILANLSGFDGSPESMRELQLEYGAEIGRSVVNFRGPIVFCVISRYHGGAFVVFSKQLNPALRVLAVEGSFASVLGGAPAAAVVFAGEVNKRIAADERIEELDRRIASATESERGGLLVDMADLRAEVRAEKISELAAEFDGIHSIHRAVEVGSVDAVISAARLRPEIIEALAEGRV